MAKGKKTGGRDWEKGHSGNPNGRPKKGHTFTEAINAEFTPKELALELRALIKEGNFPALKYAYDRMEGTPKQFIELENPKEAALLEYFRTVDDQILQETGRDLSEIHTESSEDTDT